MKSSNVNTKPDQDANAGSIIDVGEIDFGISTNIVQLATGKHHVLALDIKGQVFSWGKNDKGQLGLGIDNDHTTNI